MPTPPSSHLPLPRIRRLRFAFAACVVAAVAMACGDLMTEAPSDDDVFDAPVGGLTADEVAAFLRGDAEFARPFSAADGLGPLFNNTSCASCHSGDGRGDPGTSLARIGENHDGYLAALGGPQIQTRALPGVPPETVPAGYPVSHRLPPPVFGIGLIEAIPDATILALADSLDANHDGISGRPNWVTPQSYVSTDGVRALGRFGRKAQTSSILQQVVEAYHQDMGITSVFRPAENVNVNARSQTLAADRAADPEISAATVESVVQYVRTLSPPAPGAMTPGREEGRALFATVGCASCHVPSLRTGDHPVGALRMRDAELYSDLLLHDMGDALADNRADGDANGREWRTAPLWGTRLVARFLNGRSFYLHDGRAHSLDEAVRMHGGEAQRARDAFAALTDAQRAALLDFVASR